MKYETDQIGKNRNLKNMLREKRGNHADNIYNNVIVVVDMGSLFHKETDENNLP